LLTATLVVPEFVTVTGRLLLAPNDNVPNASEEGFAVSCAVPFVVVEVFELLELPAKPPHPQSSSNEKQKKTPANLRSFFTGSSPQELNWLERASAQTKGAGAKKLRQLTTVPRRW
jgi:hypothetical protein